MPTIEESIELAAKVAKGFPAHPTQVREALTTLGDECQRLQRDLQAAGEIALIRGEALERIRAAIRDCAHTLTEESQRLIATLTA
jgi:hypothetical protein